MFNELNQLKNSYIYLRFEANIDGNVLLFSAHVMYIPYIWYLAAQCVEMLW